MSEGAAEEQGRAANRLIDCASPYLRQHAFNPVDWYPWGEEALERAREEDKPILLSIGYSACHWCHVMERESFEAPEIARRMNEGFVCIKVDREERPDLDELYVRAVQLLSGRAGWPLTVFLTPELVPFYGGAYFPPENRDGMPGFPRVLEAVREAYEERRDEVAGSAREVLEALRRSSEPAEPEGELSEELLGGAMKAFSSQYDMELGGFGTQPKFPQAPALEFLLRIWAERDEDRAKLMLEGTLERIAAGGIRDHLGGGFHRYAVDRRWLVPHFEKMLYDNAQLIGIYADAHRLTSRSAYLSAAETAADYLLRELRDPEGGFYCAQDADSEGAEGRYYVWTHAEMIECLGEEDGRLAARYFGATEAGNWEEGKNVLHLSVPPAKLAEEFGLERGRVDEIVRRSRSRLLECRRQRPAPAIDRKVLADWNGLAVSGLVRLHRASRRPPPLEAAVKCAQFVLRQMRPDGRLMHAWQEGRARVPGFLCDHALVCAALIDLYEETFELEWLCRARELGDAMLEEYWDEEAGLFAEVGAGNEQLIAPLRTGSDQPLPSGSSTACLALLRLAGLTGQRAYGEAAERALRAALALMEQSPQGAATMLQAALWHLSEPRELAIVGVGEPGGEALRAVADEFCLPHLARAGCALGRAGELAEEVPLLEGREPPDGRPTAYLCYGGACREPTGEPDELRAQLERLAPPRH